MSRLLELIPEIYMPITLPYSKKEISVRAYKHGDSKHLLRANEEAKTRKKDKGKLILVTIEQLLQKCIKEEVEVKKLNIVDFVYLMNYINYISKDSEPELVFKCADCGKKKEFKFNVNECQVINTENINPNIEMNIGNKKIILLMKDYTFELLLQNGDMFEDKKTGNEVTQFMASFVDAIEIDGELVEFKIEEIITFLDSLPMNMIKPINDYFENIPKLSWKKQFTCECGLINDVELSEIFDFFSI